MTNNTIKHLGIVESIQGSHLSVRIVQTSACAACSAKGHCSSADSKDKIIDIIDTAASSYQVGERVMVVGEMSMGMMAVVLAFIIPFVLLIFSLFLFMALIGNELYAALLSLAVLVPYYFILWLNKTRLKQKFSFTIKPINN
ncbi:SoxR reducing system RseC family protein [Bacteroides congonensis]|uniref:SoxR reducing system RseC family protein n=1 Tax=Bacteroides congonensis TaxID=1871006 RepID=UPI00189C6C40|nr:SoxR reducing system RseC family protein [Bacteroides congonensis]